MSNEFFADPRYKAWINRVERSGTSFTRIEILAAVRRQATLFAGLVDSEMLTPAGEHLRRCMLIRGDSVMVVPVLYPTGGAAPFTLMVEQHRPVDGGPILEFAAGMLEPGQSPEECAAAEVREELGLEIAVSQLQRLHREPMRVCTGVLDERVHMFMFTMPVSTTFRAEINGRRTGEHSDGEWINVRALDFDEAGEQFVSAVQAALRLAEQVLGHRFWSAGRGSPTER